MTLRSSTELCYSSHNYVNLIEFFSTKQINTLKRLWKEGRLIPEGFGD